MRQTLSALSLLLLLAGAHAQAGESGKAKSVSQYGITWTFDKECRAGQFVNGDWWVIGPVTVVSTSPKAGPAAKDSKTKVTKNQFGDARLQNNNEMRNGSMVVLKAGFGQGYDSRVKNYRKTKSIAFPYKLEANHTLLSSVSHATIPNNNFAHAILWKSEKKTQGPVKTVAALTCLDKAPPADAFRPPFVGTEKTVYRLGEVKWDRLPKLAPVGKVPSWKQYERYFQRPWVDHMTSWLIQGSAPNENFPEYGREIARIVSTGSLLLALDVPKEKKEKLLIGMVQVGIDLYALSKSRTWNIGGGHTSGRKWPILMAGILLDRSEMQHLKPECYFHEDTQTYYGKGWFGQQALWQMVTHHGRAPTYEERPPSKWAKMDRRSHGYRISCNAQAWIGTALAARYMKAIKAWNHNAYFDYCDRWMRTDDPFKDARGKRKRPHQETKTYDPWVTAMWRAYRSKAPSQPMGAKDLKFVWVQKDGKWRFGWEENPRPDKMK